MENLTTNGQRMLLTLLKDYTTPYNANSLGSAIGISHVGSQKILKKLQDNGIVESEPVGKANIYNLCLKDDFVMKLLVFVLANEANMNKRWVEEFKEIKKDGRIIMLYGSAVKNYKTANDIDLLIVMDKRDNVKVSKILKQKQEILPKKLHAIKMTPDDLRNLVKERDKVIVQALKNSVILFGHEEFVEVLSDVTSR